MKVPLPVGLDIVGFDKDEVAIAFENYLNNNNHVYGTLQMHVEDFTDIKQISHEVLSFEHKNGELIATIETLDTATGILLEGMLKNTKEPYPFYIALGGVTDKNSLHIRSNHFGIQHHEQ